MKEIAKYERKLNCDYSKVKLGNCTFEYEVEGCIESVSYIEYSEGFNIILLIQSKGEDYCLDVLIHEEGNGKVEKCCLVNIIKDKLGALEAMYLIKDKCIEWIDENKSNWTHIDSIKQIDDELRDVFNFIILNSMNIEESKKYMLIEFGRQMNEAIGRYMDDDCSIDVILNREEQKIYGCYCSRHNSARVTGEFPIHMFLEKEIVEFCDKNDYFLELEA